MFEHPKILLVVFLILIISIPTFAFLIKQRTSFNSSAKGPKNYDRTVTQESTPSANQGGGLLDSLIPSGFKSSGSPSESIPPLPISFGPTLNFTVTIQARPQVNQATTMFVGIAAGAPLSNPSYLLSFTVDVPANGVYQGLSLAGLTIGSDYTAYLKGSAQIATSSAFVANPNITNLNNGQAINLSSGDLNDDNIINNLDYNLAKTYLGTNSNTSGWNSNIDLNLDGLVNTLDLSIIQSNFYKVGAGGEFKSRVASGSANINISSPSSSLNPPPQGASSSPTSGGYWLWVPN